jgi:hypothetical protein
MLAAELYDKSIPSLRDPALSEIHNSTVSLHYAKEGYDYPTIRLPHTFARLAGLSTRITRPFKMERLRFLS